MRNIRVAGMVTNARNAGGSGRIVLGTADNTVNTVGLFMAGPISKWGLTIHTAQTTAGVYTVTLREVGASVDLTAPIVFDEVTGLVNAVFTARGTGLQPTEGSRMDVEVVVTGPTVAARAWIWAQQGG